MPMPDGTSETTPENTAGSGSDDNVVAPGNEPEQRISFDLECVHRTLTEFDPALDELFTFCLNINEVVGTADDFLCLSSSYEGWLANKYPNVDEDAQNAQDVQDQSKLNPNPLDNLINCFSVATASEQPADDPTDSPPA
ncbi:hypothetical protein BGZ82_005575, partial [Podila clonocystis]